MITTTDFALSPGSRILSDCRSTRWEKERERDTGEAWVCVECGVGGVFACRCPLRNRPGAGRAHTIDGIIDRRRIFSLRVKPVRAFTLIRGRVLPLPPPLLRSGGAVSSCYSRWRVQSIRDRVASFRSSDDTFFACIWNETESATVEEDLNDISPNFRERKMRLCNDESDILYVLIL